jgi:hypothetical protein
MVDSLSMQLLAELLDRPIHSFVFYLIPTKISEKRGSESYIVTNVLKWKLVTAVISLYYFQSFFIQNREFVLHGSPYERSIELRYSTIRKKQIYIVTRCFASSKPQ